MNNFIKSNFKKLVKILKGTKLNICIFLFGILFIQCNVVYAAGEDVWSKAKTIMGDVYTKILGISTVAAVVTASIALLMMNFSRSGKTVDESRAWLKRIIITWAILNGLGFIMAYITPLFEGGQYTVSMALFTNYI